MKLSVSFQLLIVSILMLNIPSVYASHTIKAQPGQVRLLSAEAFEAGDYDLSTSLQYFQQDNLLKDADNSTIRRTIGQLGFGYAFTPYLQFSGNGGFHMVSLTPTVAGSSAGKQSIDLVRFSLAAMGSYDWGEKLFHMPAHRFMLGASMEVDFSKVTRFFKGPNIIPQLVFTGDFTDREKLPFRSSLNLGFRPGNGARYYDDSDTSVKDLDRLATNTINSYALTTGLGIEFPFRAITPSLEIHMEKTMNTGLSKAPKWITPAAKIRPFPQKNIEILTAVDIGLNSFSATAAGAKPDVGAVPLWNIVLGFSVANFGKKSNEVAIDRAEYENTKADLATKERIIAGLQHDLEYNTIQGKVVDSQTKTALSGVTLSFPDSADLKPSTTDSEGHFVRYFRALPGARLTFSKEGFETSSKFLSLKPGERVNVDIELPRSTGEAPSNFVATLTDPDGVGITASITLTNLKSNENSVITSDSGGQVNLRVRPGSYSILIRANGMQSISDKLDFESGKTVLRSYVFVAAPATPAPAAPK